MYYLEIITPSKVSVSFRYIVKIFRQGYDVFIEADGNLYKAGIDLTVSRRIPGERDAHVVIFTRDDKLYLQDLNSTNGTYVNGVRVSPGMTREVFEEDTITIGYYTTARVVRTPTEESLRKKLDIKSVSITMANCIRRCQVHLLEGNIDNALREFSSFWRVFKDYIEPECKFTQEVCNAVREVYQVYTLLEKDIYSRAGPIKKKFESSLETLARIFETLVIRTL
ncbi:MAG: FHA domain-containing protein [Desulfurococcaceae archaeon]|jgi:hypothetical protein|nr:FHA domain-containing protein [Desulfurococcaceae archaeon]